LPGYKYELAAFDHELSRRDEIARFLEQTSFGPTRQALDNFSGKSIAQWVHDQQENVPMTSHREYYRHRLNDRIQHPSSMGIPTQPCQKGARYRRFAFTKDDFGKFVGFSWHPISGNLVLSVDNQARTVLTVNAQQIFVEKDGQEIEITEGKYVLPKSLFCFCKKKRTHHDSLLLFCSYQICSLLPYMGFNIDDGCRRLRVSGEQLTNPLVFFDIQTPPTNPVIDLNGHGTLIAGDDWQAFELIDDPNCALVPRQRGKNEHTTIGIFHGIYFIFDPRMDVKENTLSSPLIDGGGALVDSTKLRDDEVEDRTDRRHEVVCSNARMTFLNEDFCRLSTDPHVCSPGNSPDTPIELTESTFEKIFEATTNSPSGTRYIYAVEGLRQEVGSLPYGPPCTPGERSRWVPIDCNLVSGQIHSSTVQVFAALLGDSTDKNTFVRDIVFPAIGVSCHPNNINTFNFSIEVNGQCWQNVHQSHLQVYDFSPFVEQHPGGHEMIKKFANVTTGNFRLAFPMSHPMNRFHGWSSEYRIDLGRYGDSVQFSELPENLQGQQVAVQLGAIAAFRNTGPTVVCGSPGEIQNSMEYGGNVGSGAFLAHTFATGQARYGKRQRRMIWYAIALGAADALRQRVAWALSQIFAVSFDVVGTNQFTEEAVVRQIVTILVLVGV
jgi:hypothetical protein